jgi:hypothetical protein
VVRKKSGDGGRGRYAGYPVTVSSRTTGRLRRRRSTRVLSSTYAKTVGRRQHNCSPGPTGFGRRFRNGCMDYSRRETLALGGGAAAGLPVGGLAGRSVRRSDGPDRRIVATRDPAAADAACEAVRGEERVVDLGDRRTLVAGPLSDDAVDDLLADHADDVEPDHRWGRRRPRVDGRTVTFPGEPAGTRTGRRRRGSPTGRGSVDGGGPRHTRGWTSPARSRRRSGSGGISATRCRPALRSRTGRPSSATVRVRRG